MNLGMIHVKLCSSKCKANVVTSFGEKNGMPYDAKAKALRAVSRRYLSDPYIASHLIAVQLTLK